MKLGLVSEIKSKWMLRLSLIFLFALPLAAVEFNRDIRPILSDRCFACHGPDAGNRKTKMRLDIEASAKQDLGKGRFAVVAGDAAASELFRRITSDSKTLRMPPAYAGHEKLTAVEIELIRQWINEGAVFQNHWAFIAPRKSALPATSRPSWIRNPIDAFVLARLDREKMAASPEADKRTLARRVTLDLTGIAPTPTEIDAFVADTSPNAYEKLVDRLLASTHYAERMAIRWLEAARYADTNGYQSDGIRSMWRWRDWVINAFQTNMPFDRFTIEQIAGDLLPNPNLDQKIATAFHRNHRTSAEGGIVEEEFRTEYVADRVETTSTVWMGLTFGCARCHDHKYDPIKQKEFYQLFAFFNNLPERGLVYNFGNEEPFIPAPTKDMSEKLQQFDNKVQAQQQRWQNLDSTLNKSQSSWEKRVAKTKSYDWQLTASQVLHQPLEDSGVKVDGQLPATQGRVKQARVFDGSSFTDEGSDIAKFNYQDPFTLAAWINPTAPKGAIISRAEDYLEGTGYGLYLIDGKLRLHITLRYTDISLRVESAESVKLNEWQHVAVTYDGYRKGSGVHMYVNGVDQKLNILFDELTFPFGGNQPVRIGAGGGMRFKGAIDEARIFKEALTAQQVSTLPLLNTIQELAAIPSKKRSPAQAAKLRFCFLETEAPADIKQSQADLTKAKLERKKFAESIPTVMVMKEGPKRDSFLLKRGAYDAPGEKVEADTPSFLPLLQTDWPVNRLGLAKWLVNRSNPLTARVQVNRLWQMLFGLGLVKTVEDFGSQGEWPIQPELLDWLAVEFMDSGWDVKHMLKTIVMSSTYRQSSRLTPQLLAKDPENRLLARGPRLRLSAEVLRDNSLAISGLLVDKVGGPSVKPYQPAGLWQELTGGGGYTADKGEGLYRRSLYTYWKRTIAPPSMVTFDSPTRETCTVRENRTNTPLQALNLMNDVVYLEASRKLAERMLRDGGPSQTARLQLAYNLVLGRNAKPAELSVMAGVLDTFHQQFAGNKDAAVKFLAQGDSPKDETFPPEELAAYASLASLVLNLDEAITKE